jgi:hypothetical protein
MSQEIRHSAARIRSAGSAMKVSADDFGATVQAFEAEVKGHGQPWGNDTIGQLIGVAHQVVFEAALNCFRSNHEVLHEHARNLTTMADVHAATELGNTVEVNRVRDVLG